MLEPQIKNRFKFNRNWANNKIKLNKEKKKSMDADLLNHKHPKKSDFGIFLNIWNTICLTTIATFVAINFLSHNKTPLTIDNTDTFIRSISQNTRDLLGKAVTVSEIKLDAATQHTEKMDLLDQINLGVRNQLSAIEHNLNLQINHLIFMDTKLVSIGDSLVQTVDSLSRIDENQELLLSSVLIATDIAEMNKNIALHALIFNHEIFDEPGTEFDASNALDDPLI